MPIRLLPVGSDPENVRAALVEALAGGPALVPYAAGTPAPAVSEVSEGVALVVGTSGSTGTPKRALLTPGALTASATTTHEALGGPGRWVLAMPPVHIAGIQVIVRSLLAGTTPVVVDLTEGFTPNGFAYATAELTADGDGGRRYTALVPTQVARLLDDPSGTAALAAYDAVLVGGAGTPPNLRERAVAAGITLVPTYGMSETAGGCVYAGRPLAGTSVRIEDGQVLLAGPTLALGYADEPARTAAAFVTDTHGTRWFRTADAGHVDASGLLHIDGRLDDLVNTGGYKVAPRVVEEAIAAHLPGVREVVVVGVPDDEWGAAVAAVLVLADPVAGLDLEDLRAALRPNLPAYALPRRLRVVPQLPVTGPGKPDRRALRDLFTM